MMPSIKKVPTLATLGKGVSVGETKWGLEYTTSSSVCWEGFTAVKRGGLTHGRSWGMVKAPKYKTKVSDTFSTLPRGGRTFVRKSFAIKRPAGGVSAGGDFVHIGGNASSVFREGTATFVLGRGKQVLPPLCV